MRNPKRIKNILKNIEVIWEKYPDLRLGQLLINATTEEGFYYTEDEDLMNRLKERYVDLPNKEPRKIEIPDWGWMD